ncbi:hypothetical protein CVT26_004948 [Gymnopilus dilepis]|uniref:Uncharacterized protein n=1 Tax=Gymnopilus dilepis TaxID=231916 RepID=A0A409X533_9AGAR|nr:hypothetical protein CVT26_004948 [Gymnopilus dilepis]
MNRYAQSLKDVLKTPVKDASVVSFHGETRCLTREARAIIRFVHGLKVLDASELAGVFDSNKRAVERVVGNQYHGSKMDADDVREDRGWIHPVLLGLLEDWGGGAFWGGAKKTKKQLKKDRKKNAESAASSSSDSQESISGSEKRGADNKPASSAHVVEDSQVSRITRRGRKAPLPSPPASTVEPSPAPERKVKRKRRQPASSVSVEAEVEADDEPSQPPKPKRARRSPASASASPSTPTNTNTNTPPVASASDFHRLQSFFHDLKYVPADLKRLNELGLGPAELLLTRSFEKEEAEVYFGDILRAYSKPIVVRAMAHVVYSAAERHWKVLE